MEGPDFIITKRVELLVISMEFLVINIISFSEAFHFLSFAIKQLSFCCN